jgi:hypothetical protein
VYPATSWPSFTPPETPNIGSMFAAFNRHASILHILTPFERLIVGFGSVDMRTRQARDAGYDCDVALRRQGALKRIWERRLLN